MRPMTHHGRTISGIAVATAALVLAACTPPSVQPDGSISQDPPFGVNGMAEEGGTVWVADLFGGQLLRFEISNGRVFERYGPAEGLCGTDDVVVMPDSTLVATCPTEGKVIAITRGGRARVLDRVGRGVNPIAVDPTGDSVLVGFGSQEHDRVLRVHPDGRPTEVVADGLPVLNGFDVGPDGWLYAPTGGPAGSFGTGGLGRIDPRTGAFEQIPLTFPESTRTGFDFACGVDVDAAGTVFVAQCFNPSVYAVDPVTGVARLVGRAALDTADNIVVLDDGRVLLSGFFGGAVAVFTPTPDGTYLRRTLGVGG